MTPVPGPVGWAVVDVETTGLNPVRDRIVEIAIVRIDTDGRPVDEWSTIVNPEGRRLGHTCGLHVQDVVDAPTFREILDMVLWRLAGRVIVAHNAPFDVAFLQNETIRAKVPWGPVEGFCTMEAVRALKLARSRNLYDCCGELGLAIGRQHVALDDARAAAALLDVFGAQLWSLTTPDPAPPWMMPSAASRTKERPTPAEGAKAPTTLATRVQVPPGIGISPAAGTTYLGLLDLVVEDGQVTDDEVDALSLFAKACGISRDVARRLHLAYLDEMRRAAADDGVVTEDERARLDRLVPLLSAALPR